MAAPLPDRSWDALWQSAGALAEGARRLRRLAQVEPLLGARPDFPRAHIGVPHDDELRQVLDALLRAMDETRRLIPEVFPDDSAPPGGLAADEAPRALAERLAVLSRMGARLKEDAFAPPPPLPRHAPPYLAEAPGKALPGSMAVLLSDRLEETVAALRNALLAAANTGGS